ncbi:MAG: alkaline phosphatase PhoX [Gemmatimonadota bacterium]
MKTAIAIGMTAFVVTLTACDQSQDPTPTSNNPSLEAGSLAGFRTSQPPQALALAAQADLIPLVTAGDTLPGGAIWAPIPDGLGAYQLGSDLVLYANHELSSTGVTDNNGVVQFPFARVSRLVLDPRAKTVKDASFVVDQTGQYQRLCSATWVDAKEGFPSGYFLTGEESTGGVHDGIQLAIGKDGTVHELPWLGRYAHENQIAIPGFAGKVVTMGMDDTRGASELYLYVADNEADVLAGRGKLYVFKTGAAADVSQLTEGGEYPGSFVEVTNAANLSSSELQTQVSGLGAFPFVRLEDGDYQKGIGRDGKPAAYFVDTGNDATFCAGGVVCDVYGSIYRIEFDRNDPTSATLILLERSQGWQSEWASPDNIAASTTSLMVQEDPAVPTFARAPRIYQFGISRNGRLTSRGQAVVELPNSNCVDAQGTCWESSGIINASAWMGPGSWLFDVQAHSLAAPYLNLPKENGQLLFLRIRGS